MRLLHIFFAWLALAAPLMVAAQALPPEWVQLAARGVDAAASPDNQRWYVDADGRAWRWNESQRAWVVHGSRSDLVRIDAAANGAAALTRTGELYVTGVEPGTQWQPTGVRAADVGIGGGRVWLADALLSDGTRGVLTAVFDPSGRGMQWRTVPGRVVRIDVDPQGRAWALDRDGRLYVHDGKAWIEDPKAPAGSDVGVGTRGEVYVVARQVEAALGGGVLHLRDPANGEWRQVPGRLVAVSVDREGHAFGTNSLAWVLSSTAAAVLAPGAARPSNVQPAVPSAGETTIGALAGTAQRLPEGIAAAVVKITSGNPVLPTSLVIGEAKLNGIATIVARVPTQLPGAPLLLVGHSSLALGDYLTGLQGTAAADLRFTNPVFAFVPKALPVATITAANATALANRMGRRDLATFRPASGITLLATLDLSGSGEAKAMGQAMGFDPADLALTSKDLDPAFFADVAGSEERITGAGAATLGDVTAKYGTTFAQGLEFRAPATALDKKRFGPAMLKEPVWSFAVGRPGSLKIGGIVVPGVATNVTSVLALDTTLALDLRVPAPELPPRQGVTQPPAVPKTSIETLEAKGARVVLDFVARTIKLEAKVTRAGSSSLASLKGFKLDDAKLSGAVKLPASPGVPEALEAKLSGKGELPSAARASTKVDMEVALVLDEARTSLVPTATVTSNLTLADLVGNVAPGLSRIRLTRVEISTHYVAGTMLLYGMPARAVRYQSAGMAEPVIGIQHSELNLTSYIPKLRDTQLGSFGTVSTTIFVRSDTATGVLKYDDRKSLPKELAAVIDPNAIDHEDMFPLELRPGVNLIGLYGPREGEAAASRAMLLASSGPLAQLGAPLPNASGVRAPTSTDVANARKLLAAFGIKERSYLVKANFRASTMRNAGYEELADEAQPGAGQSSRGGGSSGGTSVSARDVACGVNQGLDRAKTAGIDPVTGLDLSFKIPDFRPPYAGDAIAFSNSRFTLKEIDGQLEPAVVTSMAIRLPRSVAGIGVIGLAAKLRVKGDLDVLCKGVKPDSDVEVQFAGSTALNWSSAANVAFASLEKVTELAPVDPKLACEMKTAVKPPPPAPGAGAPAHRLRAVIDELNAKQNLGWKNAFGLPFLEIRKFAASGTFVQKEGKKGVTATSWTESVVGSQTLDVLGSLTLEAEAGGNEFKINDWLWRVPGPVKLVGLPGVASLVKAATFLELGDLNVCNLDATPSQASGTLASQKKDFTGNLVLARRTGTDGANEFDFYAAVDRFAPNMVLKKEAQLPGVLGELTLGRTMIGLRAGATTSTKVSELSPLLASLFTTTVGALASGDTVIPLVRGLSIAGRVTPKEIPDKPVLAGLRDLFQTLDMAEPVPVFGGVEAVQGAAQRRAFAEMLLPSFRVPGLPQGELGLAATRLSLSTLDGRAFSASTDVTFRPPDAIAESLGRELRMPGTLRYSRQPNGDMDLRISATSNIAWAPSFAIPELTFGNAGVEVAGSRRGTRFLREVVLTSDAVYRKLEARARLGLTSDGSGKGGTLVELISRKDGDLLDLDTLLDPLGFLPKDYQLVRLSDFINLKARGFLLTTEAGSGRVSLAAEDVSGSLNGQKFAGQLAVVGVTGTQPVLFIRSDERMTPGRIFPKAVPLGPFASLPLPEGLVVLAPSKGDPGLSSLHPRIYEKVFERLFGQPDAAKALVNDGLTVLTKLDLARDTPPVLRQIAAWLPGSGNLIVGGGVDGASGASPTLAFYADIEGLTLPIPPPADNFIQSAGGRVRFFFKTAGAGGAGAEAGLESDVKLNMPRLDAPQQRQAVDATLSVAAVMSAGSANASFQVGVQVPGTWSDPMGLEGFSLTDTKVEIGGSAAGAIVNVNTAKAEFRDSSGQSRSFLLDLASAWAGGVPTQLSVQFAKSPGSAELLVGPALQAELVNGLFNVAMKSGSSLASSVQSALGPVGASQAQLDAFNAFGSLLANSSTGAIGLMRASPLSMIAVRNPEVFFATPGNELPAREGVERPPLGLGLLVRGQLLMDVSDNRLEIASGVYKVNLVDGYYVKGRVTPPSPFNATQFELSGSQPLSAVLSAPSLSVSGTLSLPGENLVPGVSASMSGSFEVKRPVNLAAGVDIAGSVKIAGVAGRDATFTVRPGSLHVLSAPRGCIDVPVKLEGNLSVSGFDAGQVLALAQPVAPDALECAATLLGDAAAVGLAIGDAAGNLALDLVTQDPIASAKQIYEIGVDTVAVAEKSVGTAINLARDAASLVVNPTQAYRQAKAVFDNAARLAEKAAEELLNLGCSIFSWMPGEHWCRKRERQRRAAKDAADRAAWEAALKFAEEARKQNANQANAIRSAEISRYDAERERWKMRNAERKAAEDLMRAVARVTSPAWCGPGEYWAPNGIRRCWSGPLSLIAYTGDGGARCLAQNRDNQETPGIRDNCEVYESGRLRTYTDMKWRIAPAGQVMGELKAEPGGFRSIKVPTDMCLAMPSGRDGREDLNAALSISYCNSAEFPQFGPGMPLRYTQKGDLVTPEGNCLVPSGPKRRYTTAVHARRCDDPAIALPPGRLRWTPVMPVDHGMALGIAPTFKLRLASHPTLCVDSTGGYRDELSLGACNAANDDRQYMTLGFERPSRFMVASRTTGLCISSGSAFGSDPDVVNEACVGSTQQLFEFAGSPKDTVGLRNAKSGMCLAVDGTPGAGARIVEAPCVNGAAAQRFAVLATPGFSKPLMRVPPMNSSVAQKLAYDRLRQERLFSYVAVSSRAFPGRVIDREGRLSMPGGGVYMVSGRVAGPTNVTFLATQYGPGMQDVVDRADRSRVLRHSNSVLTTEANRQNDPLLDMDGTFEMVPGILGGVSFRSVNRPDQFLVADADGKTLRVQSVPANDANLSLRASFDIK